MQPVNTGSVLYEWVMYLFRYDVTLVARTEFCVCILGVDDVVSADGPYGYEIKLHFVWI